MAHGNIVESRFRPAWWLPGAHAQTIFPAVLRRRRPPPVKFEELALPDGDFVELCWRDDSAGSEDSAPARPVVAVFHGLEGSIASHYAGSMLRALRGAGWNFVLMHFRGCGSRHNRLDRSYHSGDTGDIAWLMKTLARRFPDAPLAAIGYSLGGNALLKYLAEHRLPSSLRAAAAVSVPFVLADGAERLNRGMSRLYQRHLLRRLRNKVLDKFRERPLPAPAGPLEMLSSCTDFRRFDDRFTAPLHGFSGADEYYARSSCREYLHAITVPTLILHARDDPFLTPDAIPHPRELGSGVTLELARRGGHVGFVAGRVPGRPLYWLEHRIPQFLAEQLQ
jgi:predicted alpha/beta-fold hydrolase